MIDKIALSLLIVGGINWGSVGLFNFDIVGWIFGGTDSIGARIVFVVVALCALWCISLLFRERITDEEKEANHHIR
ncbi:MAG: DUF378 domain-containing protein [Clostridia bacterium]|nr:DUF378 domain-containing protein [Clostridia bacterium]